MGFPPRAAMAGLLNIVAPGGGGGPVVYDSLVSSAGSGEVNFGNGGGDYGGTDRWRLGWFKFASLVDFTTLWDKVFSYLQLRSSGKLEWTVLGDTTGFARSPALISTGTWYCIFAKRTADGAVRIFVGDESTPLAEVSYESQTNVVNAWDDASYAQVLAKQSSGFDGEVGPCAAGAGDLSLAAAQAWQADPTSPVPGEGGRWFPGANGTSDVTDVSGNGNDGTVTATMTVGTGPTI